ncbi:class I SAM-dependent methyltransferase [Alkalicella caledoniensis]|uniref:Class I SAM-dependent methyltransferase n=1 Tax=Alkalicella caledoniensis TaxID=2731377 RepID=A0A7G9W4H6_ALKCA|nr:class I SAM-dependent methyltransferase [Alkalicella caledoniensis]QNO13588.1 class I SAM-dependent methyltransferase [Alkalicella caledoniensis]
MGYSLLAKYYDRFMSDFPYLRWGDFIISQIDVTKPTLELACGTGNLTIELFKKGIDVHGLDLNSQMLTIAKSKAVEQNLDIGFYHQNMINASLAGFSNIICPCDGINSLLSHKQLNMFFQNISMQLKGTLIFDFSTSHKLKKLSEQIFYEDYDDITYYWKTKYLKTRDIANLELTFFEKSKLGYYIREDLIIRQKGFTVKEIEKILINHGFSIEGIYDDYTLVSASNDSERVVFVCKI